MTNKKYISIQVAKLLSCILRNVSIVIKWHTDKNREISFNLLLPCLKASLGTSSAEAICWRPPTINKTVEAQRKAHFMSRALHF